MRSFPNYNNTKAQQYNHGPQEDTAHDTHITHAQHSASMPTLNPLLTPHIQLEYSVKHRSIRHHRAEHTMHCATCVTRDVAVGEYM